MTRQSKNWKKGGEKSVCCFGLKLLGSAEGPDERISNLGLALSHPDLSFFCVSFRQPGLLQAGVALMLSGATVIWYSLVWTLFDTQMRMRVHEELKSRGGYTEGAVEYLEKQVRNFLTI